MKKLFAMTLLLAAVVAAGTTTFAQGRDLDGAWVLDVEKTGKKDGPLAIWITLTASEFTANMGPTEASTPVTFKLDGTETPLPKGGAKARAKWEGNKVAATILAPNGNTGTLRFSREGAWLLMETESEESGSVKFYFKKAPPKL